MLLAQDDRRVIQRVRLFRGMSETEVDVVLAQGNLIDLPQGETVFHEGTDGTRLYIVLQGVVSIRVRGNYIAKCKPGEAFGEMAVLNRRPRSATATATTPVRLFSLEEDEIQTILDRKVAVRFLLNIIYAISERLEAGNTWATVAFEEMRQKKPDDGA